MNNLLKLKDKFIKPKEKFSVGLDIGTNSIKYVKLRLAKDKYDLLGFGQEAAGLDLINTLKKLKSECGFDAVNIATSGHQSIIRYVNFPRMDKDELGKALKFEAQKHIPFPIPEINLDGYILKENLPDNKMLVLLAAVKKDFINLRLRQIEEVGLRINIIDVDSISLINAFNINYPDEEAKQKTVALLNIGNTMTNLSILEDRLPRFSRDIYIAGNNFTQKIMDIFSLDFKVAEELKLNPDSERLSKVSAAVESVLINLAGEIRTSFDYYESQSASFVAKIYLSGGSSKFSGMKEMLSNLLGIEVEYWDPLRQIGIVEGLDAQRLNDISASLAVSVGLALRQ
ncbi:MAG: type IV pilus assembly protein PilM [Candidatus Omnitrophota bacterium]